MNEPGKQQDWLERPSTIRGLWWTFGVILAATVVAQFFIKVKPEFAVDDWFGFGAVYGFLSCLAMVVFAKVLGFLLKRDQDYYAEAPADEEEPS